MLNHLSLNQLALLDSVLVAVAYGLILLLEELVLFELF